ncbi:MAG: hypothetical protein WCT22_02495 [Patescibacteria group bacterium]|jgi:hypothetical protein
MTKKYQSPKIILKKLRINFFLRTSRRDRFGDEGILLAGCTCTAETKAPGPCGCLGP